MKKLLSSILVIFMLLSYTGVNAVWAIQEVQNKPIQASPHAKKVEIAFVFDGPNEKNSTVMETFKKTISKSLLPDFIAVYPSDLQFTGDWTHDGAVAASEKALKSRAWSVISLGYLSSDYLITKKNSNKFVITIDEYGLRDMGSNAFFNPVKQYANDFILFKKLINTHQKMDKTAILINENFMGLHKDWNTFISQKFKEKDVQLDFVVIPVSASNLQGSLNKIPKDVDSVFVTPLFNLSTEQRKELYNYINNKKLPSFSSLGEADVDLGALMGTSTPDLDRKLAEATSFNIHGYIHGKAVKTEKVPFYDDKVIFYNKDTGEAIGYSAPLRLLNNCEVISHKELPKYDLSYVFNKLEESNLDIQQKRYLIDAAKRSTVAAYLKYLPTLRIDLGYQSYNEGYAKSYSNVPTHVGAFTVGLDQMIYSPDLVTNIIVKHKKLKFEKAEEVLTEQNLGLDVANLYLAVLMLDNAVKIQDEHLHETRENLAIAQVRNKKGLCGKEEALRWAGQVSEEEKKLLGMRAELNNLKVQINKLLYKDQKEEFDFAQLTASDPAFFSSDIHILDHVRTPEKLNKFTDMLVDEVIYLSPETTKLKAAIAMKKAEISNYGQKFFMPNAKLTLEHTTQFARNLPYEDAGHNQLKSGNASLAYTGLNPDYPGGGIASATQAWINSPYLGLDQNSTRFMIAAQWKPIEGGTKIAEIARCKSELNQLNTYLTEVNTEIEMNIREVINRAISKYFMIEKSYKAMFAQTENYQMVKANYLMGKAPITQLVDAQDLYTKSKLDAMNSQYEFFKELLWVQRGLVSVNWTKATPEAKNFVKVKVPKELSAEPDFKL